MAKPTGFANLSNTNLWSRILAKELEHIEHLEGLSQHCKSDMLSQRLMPIAGSGNQDTRPAFDGSPTEAE